MNSRQQIRTLYLCYLGVREPLVQTQVLPYLRELAAHGIEVNLLSFEPENKTSWQVTERGEWCERLLREGIRWRALGYHKRPSLPATIYDIVAGGLIAARIIKRHRIDVVHGRGHIAAAMALIAKALTGCRFIFDVRGFIPEEYVDAGVWRSNGLSYRLAKYAERQCLKAADGFVVLTKRAKTVLFEAKQLPEHRPIEIIPCCVDWARFEGAESHPRDRMRSELGISNRKVIAYVGKLGGWYLVEELVEFIKVAHQLDPSTFFMLLTQSEVELIEDSLVSAGIKRENFLVRTVPAEQVPIYLRAADLAVSFVKPCYSKLSSSPTKFAEYLAAGLPVISSSGIGDIDELIEAEQVGVLIREFTHEAFIEGLNRAELLVKDSTTSERCRRCARNRFSLDQVGGVLYRRLYDRVLGTSQSPVNCRVTL